MSSGGRSHDRAVPAPLSPRRERHRGCLLLSLIVLLGNIATVAGGLPSDPPDSRGRFRTGPPHVVAGDARPAVDASGRPPFRVRQKALLGYRVDVNRAEAPELAGIPGISDAVAADWVAERRRTGRFRSPRDLLRIRGIKKKRLKKILPFLTGFHNN